MDFSIPQNHESLQPIDHPFVAAFTVMAALFFAVMCLIAGITALFSDEGRGEGYGKPHLSRGGGVGFVVVSVALFVLAAYFGVTFPPIGSDAYRSAVAVNRAAQETRESLPGEIERAYGLEGMTLHDEVCPAGHDGESLRAEATWRDGMGTVVHTLEGGTCHVEVFDQGEVRLEPRG